MADRDVTIRARWDGSDFDRGVQQSAEKVEALDRVMQRAAQGVMSGAIPPEAAQAAVGRLSRNVNRSRLEAAEDFLDPGRAIRGGESAAARAEREAQRNRVRLEEQFRIEEERYQGGQARESLGSQRNRVRLEEQLRRDQERFEAQRRREFERTDPEFLARRGIEARQRRAAVRAEMEALDPELEAERLARENRYRNPLAGTAFARLGSAIFLAHTAASVTGGAARGFGEAAELPGGASVAEGLGLVFRRMAEGIPIIGGFVRAMDSLPTAVSLATRAAEEFAATAMRRTGAAFGAQSIRTAAGAEITGLQGRLAEAGISSATAAGTLARFNMNPGDYTNPIAVAGVTTGREGDLELAAMQARTGALGAEDVARAQAERAAVARAELERRQGVATGFRGQMAQTANRADALDIARTQTLDRLLTPSGIFGGVFFQGPGAEGEFGLLGGIRAVRGIGREQANLRGLAGAHAEQLAGAEGAVAQQAKIVQQELTKLEQDQEKAAKARVEAKRGELDIERNKLQVLDQQIARGRGQEIQAGLMGPGQLEQLAQFAQQAKEKGILSLPPEFRQQLLEFVGEPGQEQMRGEVRADPRLQGLLGQIRGAFGQGAVPDVENQRKAIEQGVKGGILQNQAELQKAFEDGLRGVFDPLVDAIRKAMDAKIAAAAANLAGQNIVGQLQGR